jgi:hypothetical protein
MSEQDELHLALKEMVKWARKAGKLEGAIDSVIWRLHHDDFDSDKANDLAVELSNLLAEIEVC